MGFKKENYTLKGICVCMYFLLIANIHSISGQSHCPIRVDYEPRATTQTRSANTIDEVKFPFFQPWEDLNNLRLSDDEGASVSLPSNKRSTLFKGSNLAFSLPAGAQISGIELIVEGHSQGQGLVEDQMIRLLNANGEAAGDNKANSALPIDKDWVKNSDNNDFIWRYGSPNDTWGMNLHDALINDQDFGYALQIRNKLNKPIAVFIDNIQIVIHYTPLYEVCSTHPCVPFYVDKSEDPLVSYEWYLPQGFELISDSEEDYAINIGPSYAEFGMYEICVESFYKQSSLGTCCRNFNFKNCEPAQISGQVFFDQNNDSSNNNNDTGIENILIHLFSNQGTLISTTFTNDNGDYAFSNLLAGQYYIEVFEDIDSLLFTTPNVGPEAQDSDITGAFGDGTSDLVILASGDSTAIDAGLNLALSIGDFVWEDLNGDGIQQSEEPGIANVLVQLTTPNNDVLSAKTDEDGYYSFSGLPPGDYAIEFPILDDFIPTIPNIGNDLTDSDFEPIKPIYLSFTEGGAVDSIDVGYYRSSEVGDFVWQDLNENGLQDESEPGISDAIMHLLDGNDDILQTVISDSLGSYLFENIAPGKYYIEIQTDIRYSPTEFEIGGGISSELDSDTYIQDDRIVTSPFIITSNTTNLSIDLGFVEKPALLGGFTFLDENNNGQYDLVESFVPNVNILLYNFNNVQVDSTQSDDGGFYEFENVPASNYYLIFELKEDLLFTLPNVGDDLADSDVTNTIVIGRTDLFELLPDEENYSLSAGYLNKPKVGDFVWLDTNGNGIQDADDSGLNDVTVELYNEQNELQQSTVSGTNPETLEPGYYQFESIDTGNYYIKVPIDELYEFAIVDDSAIGMNSSITGANGIGTSNTFSLEGNQCNNDIDAGYAFKKGNIKGEVWIDRNEDGIQDSDESLKGGVFIELFDDSGELLFFRNSNENGQYIFTGLDAGEYYVVFTPSEQYRFTLPYQSSDTSIDSDVVGEISAGSTWHLTVMDGITLEDIDAGLIDGSVTIDGVTWEDANGDGIQQMDESPLADVSVELYDLNDSLLASTITSASGDYSFEDNHEGQYYIVFTPENNSYINTLADQGNDDNFDDDVTSFFVEGSTDTVEIIYFQEEASINAGYYRMASIGDQVFIDLNENDVNDNEAGLDGVIVNLLDDIGTIISSDTTAQGGGLDSGYYLLENIPPGMYTVEFIRPLFYQFVAADQGGDDNLDSDVTEITNIAGTTNEITVTSGQVDLSVDAGLFFQIPAESSITGSVWDDENTNGIRDHDEAPIPSIPMQLVNQDGDVVGMTTSNEDGNYIFENLTEGFYKVQATVLLDKVATLPNTGSDDNIDSDFIHMIDALSTEVFFLATFEDIENVDLGLVNKLRIGDFVWEDLNNNGSQDANEIGIEEIEITITSENGAISETVMSDAEGAYQFIDLPAGYYKICADLPSGFHFAKSNIGTDLLDSDVDSTGCTEIMDFTSGGTINDLDIGLTKNGSINGIAFIDLNGNGVINLNDPGLDGVLVNLHSASGELLNSTVTSTVDDMPGIFEFKNLKATDYYLVFEFPDDYIITNPDIGDDLTDSDITGLFGVGSTDLFPIPSGGIVTSVNGGAYLPASVGDEVWIDENADGIRNENENGAPNIEVIIFRSFGIPFDTTVTDNHGYYQFEGLKQGLYFIQFVIPQEFAISPSDQGIDDNIDSDADNTGKTPLISLAHGADLESVDCGIYAAMASLRSVVWNDSNGDGMRQNQEARIPGIRISLHDDSDNLVESTETNSLGLYAFQKIPTGNYKIFVDIESTDYAFTEMNMNDDDYHDSDIKPSGESEIFFSDQEQSTLSVPNVDAGLYESGGIISEVWEDKNANGIYDINEIALANVEVSLYTKDGIFVSSKISSLDDENVQFNNITPGIYYLEYSVIEQYVSSPKSGSMVDNNNSDVSIFNGNYKTPFFQVLANEITTNIDAGFYKGTSVTSQVWIDSNANGLQDDQGEVRMDIFATIYEDVGKSIMTQSINQDGQIQFSGIPKGEYYIKFHSPSNLAFTKTVEGDAINSDVDHSYGLGTTKVFEFEPYQAYTQIDAGLLKAEDIVQSLAALSSSENKNSTRKGEGIDEDDLSLEVHPNPAANYLKIKVDTQETEGIITIRNNQNQLVFSKNAAEIDKIDLSDFHPGIYYVKYDLRGKSIVRKILKIQ